MDLDDLTNSSILEFLNQEKQCLDYDNGSELDVESLFEEINRLSDNTVQKNFEDIMKEAELLMQNESFSRLTSSRSIKNKDKDEGNISKESTPREMRENTEYSTKQTKIIITESPLNNASSLTQLAESKLNFNDKILKNERKNSKTKIHKDIHEDIKWEGDTQQKYNNNLLNNTFVKNFPNQIQCSSVEKQFTDKSTSPSPTISQISVNSFSWTRERTLEREIEELQENLKDTEERFQSLRIQHDSLSQIHRDLKENCSQFQEETEKLKLDVQHLSDCANILRSELQTARMDRTEALELQKTLQSELDENRLDRKKYEEQKDKDAKIIQDLQRQCREMERILMRKHPDSVSALIVASKNSSNPKEDNSSSRRLLEQRISQLETDAREQDDKAQKILANVQARFSSVQSKYETHIADLETQVLSLQDINSKLNEKLTFRIEEMSKYRRRTTSTSYSQTEDIAEKEARSISVASQTDTIKTITATKMPSVKKTSKLTNSYSDTTIHPNNGKEDSHLLATIRGMRVDLAIKEKAMQRLTRELEECKKTIKKLQKERDVYLKSDKSGPSIKKPYDPSQFTEIAGDSITLKEAYSKIKLLELDYKTLHEKRLQDLKTLQAAHERELSSCNETVKILQGRLVERDEAIAATQKKRRLPIDYYALKAKVSSLERRHSEREQRLHLLVDALSKGRLNGEQLTDYCKNGQLNQKYDINSN